MLENCLRCRCGKRLLVMTRVIISTVCTTASNLKAEQEIIQASLPLSQLWTLATTACFNTLDLSSDHM